MHMGVVSIQIGNDMLIDIPAPLSRRTNPAVPTTMDGGSMTAYALDMEVVTQLTAAVTSGATSFPVASSAGFAVGDALHLWLDSGAIFEGVIATVPDATTITTSSSTVAAADAGKAVYKRLGTKITGAEYGTAAIDTVDWGYKAIIETSHSTEFTDLKRFLAEANIIVGSDDIRRTWEVRLVP